MLYNFKGHVPVDSYETPFGKARVLAQGDDITLIGISHGVAECLRARQYLAEVGIAAEVIDPVTLTPLDMTTISQSVAKTGKLLVVDTGWTTCGASAEILAQLAENPPEGIIPRMARIGFAPTPCPTTRPLENIFYPDAHSIAASAWQIVKGKSQLWVPPLEEANEISEFRGPF